MDRLYGNGKLEGKNKVYRLTIQNKDKNFVLWQKSNLANFVNVIKELKDGYDTIYKFSTLYNNEFSFYNKLFYQNNRKTIKEQLISKITNFSLAVWIMNSRRNKKPESH